MRVVSSARVSTASGGRASSGGAPGAGANRWGWDSPTSRATAAGVHGGAKNAPKRVRKMAAKKGAEANTRRARLDTTGKNDTKHRGERGK